MPVPDVLGWDARAIAVSWVPGRAHRARRPPSASAGISPACTWRARPGYGAPWPGFIASLPLGSGAGNWADRGGEAGDSWPQWYGRERLLPYARRGLARARCTRPTCS